MPKESERFRSLGRLCAQAVNTAVRSISPGQSEFEIAARLSHEAQSRGIQPIVNLIATDERVFAFRHPLPTEKKSDHCAARDVYAESGFPDEWQFQHHGGDAGYESREYLATSNSRDTVLEGQAFAWNPSIAGYKLEDTIIVSPTGNEVVTAISDWPHVPVSVVGQIIPRPRILLAT